MPPKRPASTAFKPPRPKAPTTTGPPTPNPRTNSTRSAGSTTRPRAKFIPAPASSSSDGSSEEEDDDNNDDDDSEEPSEQDSPSNNETSSPIASPAPLPTRNVAPASRSETRPRSPGADPDDDADAPPVMPEKLLTALLYSHFQQPETKIGREARDLVGKYVETFVREAVARAIVERKGVAGGGDFLEVEDLEKLAPQLILDF